jgi:regulator of nucleoside diphosphate kinase
MRLGEEKATIFVSDRDMARLRALVDRHDDGTELLAEELDRAIVLPQDRMPPSVVTMRSRVAFEDQETGRRREAQLVYPGEADPRSAKISILAPVGTALLGLSVGDSIAWPLPRRTAILRVVEVLYQPEAAGDVHL